MSDLDVTITNNESAHRYEAHIDGQLVGQADYKVNGNTVYFTHTEVSPRYEGQGVGGQLVSFALDDVVRTGKRIVPACSFVAAYVEEHPDYQRHVA